jgi:hypothetical protein
MTESKTTKKYLVKGALDQLVFKDCRPCPWCANTLFTPEGMQKRDGNVAMFCYYCGATGLFKKTIYAAYQAWNRRGLEKERRQHYAGMRRTKGTKVTVTYVR